MEKKIVFLQQGVIAGATVVREVPQISMTQNIMNQLEVVPASINRGISFIIYGEPGVGKTTMATTLPVNETLIINTEAGLGPLLGTGHHVFNVVKALENKNLERVIEELYITLLTDNHPWKNIVIDNLSELESQLILHLTQVHKKEVPEIREYGDASYKMRQWVHNFRDLVYRNINVIFNAWEFPLEIKNTDGQVLTRTFPLVGKKIAPQLCGLVDVVGHMEIYQKTNKRWVRFGPHEQYITKSQFQGLETGEQPDFKPIIEKLLKYDYTKSKSNT